MPPSAVSGKLERREPKSRARSSALMQLACRHDAPAAARRRPQHPHRPVRRRFGALLGGPCSCCNTTSHPPKVFVCPYGQGCTYVPMAAANDHAAPSSIFAICPICAAHHTLAHFYYRKIGTYLIGIYLYTRS